MGKFYKIPAFIYVETFDSTMAQVNAELICHEATYFVRKDKFIKDTTTILQVDGIPEEITKSKLPTCAYNKELLTNILGEEKAIRFLNYACNKE